jgi:hypothetical protein
LRRSRISGNVVALAREGVAVRLGLRSRVDGSVVTGGGSVVSRGRARVGGSVDTSGSAPELDECMTARAQAVSKREEFAQLQTSPDLDLGAVKIKRMQARRIPAAGDLGPGQVVIDMDTLRIGHLATLTLAGAPTTQQVIVRIAGRMLLSRNAGIRLEGLTPEQVIYVVEGPVYAYQGSRLSGTVFAAGTIETYRMDRIDGALFGSVRIALRWSILSNHPFVGW